jgi:hypothetical protein
MDAFRLWLTDARFVALAAALCALGLIAAGVPA